jgi:hypothetical protein
LWQAVIVSSLGWLIVQIWRRTLGRPVYALGFWLERHVIGVRRQYTLRDLPRLRRRGSRQAVSRTDVDQYSPTHMPQQDPGEEQI